MLSEIEKKALRGNNYDCFKGVDLERIKEKLSDILSHLRDNGFFTEYTQHDISHVNGMFEILEYLIPIDVKTQMTSAEWMMLVLSVYFHDYGMLVTQSEVDHIADDENFQIYKDANVNSKLTEKELYQDYVRIHHGDRICEWLLIVAKQEEVQPNNKVAVEFLKEMIGFLPENVLKALAELCMSHQQEMEDVYMCLKNKVDFPFSMSSDTTANLLYVASLLRTADLLHINMERTPSVALKIISPRNTYSKTEWNFQKGITCIRPKKETNRDGKKDKTIKQHTIEIIGNYKDEEAYQRLNSYLDYAEEELRKTYHYCKISQEDNDNIYSYPWDSIDRTLIVTEGFFAKPMRFELDKKNILKLLIGHTLYNNPNVVLRELTQNAIDACRLMNTLVKDGSTSYTPKVIIHWDVDNRLLKIQDNGTGMNDEIILNYLLKVGVSRYQSADFKKDNPFFHSISRFGIGLLTCFMISDQIEMYSLWNGDKKAYRLMISEVSNEYILRNDATPDEILERKHGTTFILKVHDDVDFSNVLKSLKRWILVPRCHVEYREGNDVTVIGYKSEEEAMTGYMQEAGLKIDNTYFRLKQLHKNGMIICAIEKKNDYFGEWSLYTPENRGISDIFLPIGTCVEGIMVSTDTPGFNTRTFLSLVNCVGSDAPNTNVARDQLEEGKELDNLNKFVYDFYLGLISEKIKLVEKEYSVSWSIKISDKYIDSFMDNFSNDLEVLADSDMFNKCLSAQNCYLVDSMKAYHKLSLDQIGSEVWTIENYAYDSAMHLSQELPNCDKTAIAILSNFVPEYSFDRNAVLSVIDSSHYTYRLFLQRYEVGLINIDRVNRRIAYKWMLKEDRWYSLCLNDYYYGEGSCNVFIEKSSDKVILEGETNVHFIRSKFGLMILSSSPLCSYLSSLMGRQINYVERCVEFICSTFLRTISDNDVFVIENFCRYLENEIPSDVQDFFEYVDKQQLVDALQNEKEAILSLDKLYNIL